MTDKNLESLFQRAAAIAKLVPQNMQEAAFNRALDALQRGLGAPSPETSRPASEPVTRTARRTGAAPAPAPLAEAASVQKRLESLNRTDHPAVMSAPRVLERALLILQAAGTSLEIDGIAATDIAKVLTDKFRIRTTHQAVRQALDKAVGMVDRRTTSGVTTYHLMLEGEQHLASPQLREKRPGREAKVSGGKRRQKEVQVAESGAKSPSPAAQASSTGKAKSTVVKDARNRRPGGLAAIRGLLESAFFSKARTIGDMIQHLDHERGYTYKASELSPGLLVLLRANPKLLTRAKDADGRYEYKAV